ncbi:SWIM zinc finger family protein [Nocardioides bizhenqiangii]|uniref:SWIM zinc finger family protein n=1 Tax=Nocardioides bizhenqiangii TaxID=3095076 RepID=A0ABZ0ZPZ6_9ACTN|nr:MULTISPECIES: SWIM zinc finger family protein [unclassified Nocardioides]MDZ5619542.1 SWIM zinc finger family protein [Nocardioides sp. HM23]WQQ26441.1 SWIM zinc finger family protein [Nocardioides sp. HM61]
MVGQPGRVTHGRLVAPRTGIRSWWGKAWHRAVEEAAYVDTDLRGGRTLARRGEVGGISVAAGSLLAAVREGDDAWTAEIKIPVLAAEERRTLVEVVAAEAGRIAALLAGELPFDLVEHAEEAGVELLPYGGELAASCTCNAYLDPCRHALAVLIQTGWLVDADPLVLFAVRGLDREALLAELHERSTGATAAPSGVTDLADDIEVAADAVLRARRLVELMETGAELPDGLV